ncbi:MAG: hypothetical protein V4527_12400 [Pseudomonadota bacterium]|jgi:hypothetical protein
MDLPRIPGTLHLVKTETAMPPEVKIGQHWSIWVPGRRQWLLTTVIKSKAGEAVLKYDPRYGMGLGYDEQKADEGTMLTASNLFRYIDAH